MGSRPFKWIPLAVAAVIMVSGVFAIKIFTKKDASNSTNNQVSSTGGAPASSANSAQVAKSQVGTAQPVSPSDAPTNPNTKNAQSNVAVEPVSPTQTKVVVAPAPTPVCKTLSFRHKSARGHSDAEECSEHRNFVGLEMQGIDQKSICLRVDGVPAAFEREKDGLVFGAIAGPKTNISVEMCANGAVRTSECVVARDQFMDALGGSEKQERSPASAKWNANDSEDDPDAVGEMDRELQEEASVAQGLPVFRGWVVEK